MVRLRRPSTKQHVRIWFEFYKLAWADGRYNAALNGSREYYEPWGEVVGIPFDRWWKEHARLFDELKVREVASIGADASSIYLAVPLDLDTKRIIQQVRDLIAARQQSAADAIGGKLGRSNRVGLAKFGLTPGVEFRSEVADKVLRVYRDVYLPEGCPAIGPEFAQKVVEYLAAPRIKMKIHFLPQGVVDAGFSPEQLRNLRRYVKRAEAYMEAAAKGNFPGSSKMI